MKINQKLKEEINKLRKEGMTYPALGLMFGVSKYTIKYWVDSDYRAYRKNYIMNRVNKIKAQGRCPRCGKKN